MGSRSKTMYQGMNLRRLPRAELDDSVIRDQSRYITRLDHNLKDFDKAKHVMAKSMEADKQRFLMGGKQNNKKVIKSPLRYPEPQSPLSLQQQHSRFVPDIRAKRSGYHDYQTHPTSIENNAKVQHKDDVSAKRKTSSASSNGKSRSKTSPTSIDTIYSRQTNIESDADISRAATENRNDTRGQKGEGQNEAGRKDYDDNGSRSQESKESPDRKLNSSSGLDTSGNPQIAVSAQEESQGSMGDKGTRQGKDSTCTTAVKSMSVRDDDYYFQNYGYRRGNVWDHLSTPKHQSLHRYKREQLEREFSSASLNPRGSMGVAKSARGYRTPADFNATPSTTTSTATSSGTRDASRVKSSTGRKKGP